MKLNFVAATDKCVNYNTNDDNGYKLQRCEAKNTNRRYQYIRTKVCRNYVDHTDVQLSNREKCIKKLAI
jgi:hypothetical protein